MLVLVLIGVAGSAVIAAGTSALAVASVEEARDWGWLKCERTP